jgi:cysteinyl-tRNA synthetase
LLTDWGGYKWPGEALRFNMLKTHYRQPLDWTYSNLDEAHGILWEWYGDLKGKDASATGVPGHVLDALSDDLNTPKAIAAMHELHSAGKWSELRAALPDAALAPLTLCTDNAAMVASAGRYVEAIPFARYLALDAYASTAA